MISSLIRFKPQRVRRLLRRTGGGTALEYAVLLGSVVVVLVLALVSLAAHVGLSYESITANVPVAPAATRATSGVRVTSEDGVRAPSPSTATNDRDPDSRPTTVSPH